MKLAPLILACSLLCCCFASTARAATPCTTAGLKGECILTSTCSSQGGKSTAGLCPGAADNQCCTYGTCTSSGTSGKCQPITADCTGSYVAGLCPGPVGVKCCVPPATPAPSDVPTDVPKAALDIIKKFEGFRTNAYPDPASGGEPWTIGYGTTVYCNGVKVKKGDVITRAKATTQLSCKVKSFQTTLSKKIPTWADMNTCQKSAILSFGYNVGPGFYGRSSFASITSALKTKANWVNVPTALKKYVYAAGKKLQGLVNRRNAEATLWSRADAC